MNFAPHSFFLLGKSFATCPWWTTIGVDLLIAHSPPNRGANLVARLERFLNSQFHYKIMSCPHHFIRLGLSRPYHDFCCLMLDTLFPLPHQEWLEEF